MIDNDLKPPDNFSERADRKKVLLVAPRIVATFIRQDFAILKSAFDTEMFVDRGLRSLADLKRRIAWADVVVIWFAGRHAGPAVWLANRLKRPVITIVGGYEAAWVPEINYGMRPGSLRARVVRWILRHSRKVVVVSRETEKGVMRMAPEVSRMIELVYNAVDIGHFTMPRGMQRSGVLCVGGINKETLINKGWVLYSAAADLLPDVSFAAVGPVSDSTGREWLKRLPDNMTWRGELHGLKLVRVFQSASVYVQASRHESFSLSLAEAMACGCIPVVSRFGALPEVAGDQGTYVDRLDAPTVAAAIREALQRPDSQRAVVRQRIVEHFRLEHRRDQLCALVDTVLRDGRRLSD